jgi:hypothetical protein
MVLVLFASQLWLELFQVVHFSFSGAVRGRTNSGGFGRGRLALRDEVVLRGVWRRGSSCAKSSAVASSDVFFFPLLLVGAGQRGVRLACVVAPGDGCVAATSSRAAAEAAKIRVGARLGRSGSCK